MASFTDECNCDPLKVTIHWFFREVYDIPPTELGKVHLFYKSSVFRYPAQGNQLGFKILQETLKTVHCWLDEGGVNRDEERDLENVGSMLVRISGKLHEHVQSIVPDALGNLTFTLDIPLLNWILKTGPCWSKKDFNHNTKFEVEVSMTHPSTRDVTRDFNERRKLLVAQTVTTVCKKVGYKVDAESFTCVTNSALNSNNLLIACKTIDSSSSGIEDEETSQNMGIHDPDSVLKLIIGGIVARQPRGFVNSSFAGLLNKRESEVRIICESRQSEQEHSTLPASITNLAKATINFDILVKPVGSDIILKPLGGRHLHHDAIIIMYNYSRILSILKRFEEEYPPLPDANSDGVDFSRIGETNEELHLVQLLLEWPRILETVINFVKFEPNLCLVPKFSLALAKAFNSFYRETVVLVPLNAPHNFPEMMARIYLLKGIRNVFVDCLEIMQIDPKIRL